MHGIEYDVVYHAPGLFVIEKRFRRAPESAEPLGRYYIANGVIYQAPDLRSVVTTRVVRLLECVMRVTWCIDFCVSV